METIAFLPFFIRFSINLIITLIIVRYLYYPVTRRKDYLFTYLLISTTVFFLCYLLENVKLQLGFALGLFAIFGIIRYRTTSIPIKEMTYLFVLIGLAVINALTSEMVDYTELLFANITTVVIIFILERVMRFRHEAHKQIIFDNLDLIHPSKRLELKKELEERTGLVINKIEIGKIDYSCYKVSLIVYYFDENNTSILNDLEN